MNELIRYSHYRISETSLDFSRYLMQEIDWNHRLIGITGSRGTGKTTLMLQYLKKNFGLSEKAIYLSLDNIHFLKNNLLQIAEDLYNNGVRHLFLDEVHRYPTWAIEIKNIYDIFRELKIVFSGSSSLQILKAEADLSRRTAIYKLRTMSFREYLALSEKKEFKPFTLEYLLENHKELAAELTAKFQPLPLFNSYLKGGTYPFFTESQAKFPERLQSTVNVILETDIPAVEKITYSSIISMKRILALISDAVPFKPNISELSRKSGVTRDVLLKLISLLERSGILMLLRQDASPTGYLTKPEKIYLDNTALLYALSPGREPEKGTLRETFFAGQLLAGHQVTIPAEGDFMVDNRILFEVGGKNKTTRQIWHSGNAFIGADDIVTGYRNVIPLWLFGLLY